MTEPVTVIITCFNLNKYIRDAVESVFAQDYDGLIQVVVVDDCSTDNSPDILNCFNDIELVLLTKNGGVMNATLEGLKRARHDAVFFLDGDDIWHPSKLSQCMMLLDENAAFITHDLHYIDRERRTIARSTKVSQVLGNSSNQDHDRLIRHCITQHLDYVWLGSAYGIRRSLARIDDFFAYCYSKQSLEMIYQDWPIAVWVAVAGNGKMRYVDTALFDYRIHGENYSGNSQTREKFIRNLTKSRDTMRFIEEVGSFLESDTPLLPAYSRARAKYDLQLAAMQEPRVRLIRKALSSWDAFGWNRDGAKLAARVCVGIMLGPEKAHRVIEMTKSIRVRK
jgi:glycosyltransferase involved in cell wall biosynthesis